MQAPEPDLHPESLSGKNVVIGIGNPYMRDDGIGIQVVNELRKLNLGDEVLVYDYQAMDLSLLLCFEKASKVIIVDALKSGSPPGAVSKYSVTKNEEGPLLRLPNLHELQLYDIVDLASQTGILPFPLIVIGIEPKDCTIGEGLTDEVAAAVPKALSKVVEELRI